MLTVEVCDVATGANLAITGYTTNKINVTILKLKRLWKNGNYGLFRFDFVRYFNFRWAVEAVIVTVIDGLMIFPVYQHSMIPWAQFG